MTKFEDMEEWEKSLRGCIQEFNSSGYALKENADYFYMSYIGRQQVRGRLDRVAQAEEHKELFMEIVEKLLKKKKNKTK